MFPGDQRAIVVGAAADLNQSGGTEIGPGKFLFACPDNLDRLAGCLGQTRCFNGGFARMFAAVAAAHVGLNHANFLRRKMKRSHQFIANAKGPLRSGPDSQLAVLPFGHGGTRFQRRMRNVLHRVLLVQLDWSRRHRLRNKAADCFGPSSSSVPLEDCLKDANSP